MLDTYASLKRINKYEFKLGLQKSISLKNKLHVNFINKKDLILKEEYHTTKNIEIYSPPIWREVKRLIMINSLKQIGIILRTLGKSVASNVPSVLSLDKIVIP